MRRVTLFTTSIACNIAHIVHRVSVALHLFYNDRHDLINDKQGIILTSVPQGDEAGVIETILKPGRSESIVLTVKNMDHYSTVHVKDITLLWSTSLFDYRDIREIAPHKKTITPGQ